MRLCGIAAWYVLSNEDGGENTEILSFASSIKEIISVLKIPAVWLIAVVVLAAIQRIGVLMIYVLFNRYFLAECYCCWCNWHRKDGHESAFSPNSRISIDEIGIASLLLFYLLCLSYRLSSLLFYQAYPHLPVMLINIAIASFAIFALKQYIMLYLKEESSCCNRSSNRIYFHDRIYTRYI